MEQFAFYNVVILLKNADGMANGVDPHQTSKEQPYLGLHCHNTVLRLYLGVILYYNFQRKEAN